MVFPGGGGAAVREPHSATTASCLHVIGWEPVIGQSGGASEASLMLLSEPTVGALKRDFVLGVGVLLGASSCVVVPYGAVVLVLKVWGPERAFVCL